jgi:hypothetical protein
MTIMAIGSAIAGGASTIFGGRASAAAARAQNEQAIRNWYASNTQKTFNNSREQFQAAYQFTQQLKRNSAIAEAAYQYQREGTQNITDKANQAQLELSRNLRSQQGLFNDSVANRGLVAQSGTSNILAAAQAFDALKSASILQQNKKIELENLNKQFQGMLSQQTENIFMPNIQGYDAAPILGSTDTTGTDIAGALQIGTGIAGGVYGMMDSTPSTSNTQSSRSTSTRTSSSPSRTTGGFYNSSRNSDGSMRTNRSSYGYRS